MEDIVWQGHQESSSIRAQPTRSPGELRLRDVGSSLTILSATQISRDAIFKIRRASRKHSHSGIFETHGRKITIPHSRTPNKNNHGHSTCITGRPDHRRFHRKSGKFHSGRRIPGLWTEPRTWPFFSLTNSLYLPLTTETILATCAPYNRADIACYLDAVWYAIVSETVDDQLQAKNWDNWMEFCSDMQRDPYLKGISTTIQHKILLGFYAQNRRGYYSRGCKVGSPTPHTALRHMSQTIVLAGYEDPWQSYGSTYLDLPFFRLLIYYKTIVPSPKYQLALPIWAIQCAAKFYRGKNTPKGSAISDLLTLSL